MRISDWSSDVCSSDLERHGVDDAVRLGGRRHLALADPPAQVEGVTHDAVGAVPRHDGLLDRHLALGATVQPAADLGILTFVVLANPPAVDVLWAAPRPGALHSLHHPTRQRNSVGKGNGM